MAVKRIHIFASGRVQGVFYRRNTQRMALELGLKGWVRNLPDGRVEAVVEGDESQIEKLVHWCRTGPPGAVIDHLEVREEPITSEFTAFEVRY